MPLSESESSAFSAFEKAGWEKAAEPYHHHWGTLSAQSAEPMLDAAGVAAGKDVLDVGTGAGYVAAAATRCGANAVGLDFSAAQVELARKRVPAAIFRQGDAENLPFENASFDAVVSGFTVNHLPHAERTFAEAWRVLRPGGRFAYTVWAQPGARDGFGIVLKAIEAFGSPNASLPPAPPYFRFADEREARAVFASSGFVDVSFALVPQVWRHRSPDDLFDAFDRGAVRATAMLRAQPPEVRERIRGAVRAKVEALQSDGVCIIQVPAALASGRKPG
jgi:SAM-dependent methyltransferase